LCCAAVCWSGWSEDLVNVSHLFLFPVLFSDTADLQQSDSVSNYDAEVCGVVNLVNGLSVTALLLLRTWLTMLITSVALSKKKKKEGEIFHLRICGKESLGMGSEDFVYELLLV
jgi:hypothetical protein